MKKLCLSLSVTLLFFTYTSLAQFAVTSKAYDEAYMDEFSVNKIPVGNAYEVLDIYVDAKIKNQIAEVSVTQNIYNPGNRELEVEVFFPLPNNGIVQNFMMMIDGKEGPGKLMKKEEAKRIYQDIVRRKRDPALMEYVGYGLFKTSVFPIAVGEERKITVSYTQICNRQLNAVSFSYPFGTQKFSSKALKTVSLNARIESSEPIKPKR